MSEVQSSIEERVKKILNGQFVIDGRDIEAIRNEQSLVGDLDFDSLDLVVIVMTIEDEFGMEITDEDAEKLTTVQQVINYVTANVKA